MAVFTLKTLIPNSDYWPIARLCTDHTARREVNRLYRGIAGPNLMLKIEDRMEMRFPFSG